MSFFHSYIYLYINIHAVYRYIYENPQVTQKCFFFPHNKAWWQWLHIYTERCRCCSCGCCWMSGRRAAHVYLHDVGVKQMAGMWARIAQCVRGASWGGGLKKKKREMKNREFGLGQFLTSPEVALPSPSADISTYRWRYSSTSYLLLPITRSNSNHWDDFMHALLIWHNALGFRQTELCCIGNRSSEVRGAATTPEEKLQQMSRLFLSSRATFTDHFMALWGKISDLQHVKHFVLADILFPDWPTHGSVAAFSS